MVEEEDGHPALLEAVAGGSAAIGAPTLFETAMVLVSREGTSGMRALLRFLDDYRVTLLDFDEWHVEAAVRAFVRYGKGRHPARLNYGDCMTYAVAKLAGAPLLFVGDDFARTDLEPA
jgi:ribonuclease VapC